MSWLKKLLKRDLFDAQHAIVDALCLSLCADGEVANVEVDESIGYIVGMTGVSKTRATSLLNDSLARVAQDPQGVLHNLTRLAPTQDARRGVLFAAVFIQYVDGKITKEEDMLLSSMAQVLSLSDDEVRETIEQVEAQLAQLSADQ